MGHSLLADHIAVKVATATPKASWGPSSIFGYTLLQGLFTVLVIKEIVSVTRNFVIGSSSSLRINRLILWSMVEDWDDLAKTLRNLLWPQPLQHASENRNSRAPFNRVGWTRLVVSSVIALFLFSFDIALIVLSVSNRAPQDAGRITKLKWANTGDIPILTESNTLQGSFSKAISLESEDNDVEFTRLPAVSVERTDFRDFQVDIPEYNGRLIACNNTEWWRMICRIHCKNRYYQYKLRMDVATETNTSTFFVPTTDFSVQGHKNNIAEYAEAMRTQLGILITHLRVQDGYFEMNTTRQADEYTTLPNSDKVLTHDAIATLFLKTIEIHPAPLNMRYYERETGKRLEKRDIYPRGVIAKSQRPYLPLFGTILLYIIVQLISIVQYKCKLRGRTNDMTTLVETFGGNVQENVQNIVIEDWPLVQSESFDDGESFQRISSLPAGLSRRIKDYWEHGKRSSFDEEPG